MNPIGGENDSQRRDCGAIPGAPGIPAFSLFGPDPSRIPVMIAVPHAGRVYPRALLRDMRHADLAALKLEDRYADRLAHAVARETGAALLIANAPRAMIDLNRAPDDVDWEMFPRGSAGERMQRAPSRRARSGLGLIPRRLSGIGEIWRRRQDLADLDARIAGVHGPYHETLASTLAQLQARWGAALLLDLHSMPPLASNGGRGGPHFVIGDRFGASCHGGITAAAFSCFHGANQEAAHNRPYAGGYVLERHSDTSRGLHAIQLEIDRSRYLDSRLAEPGPGFDDVAALLTNLVRDLAQEVSQLGQLGDEGMRQAAE
ncbi:N-formylglutamate amidohydrolase [Novosphingobium sp. PC22D]|uniref:N-formylglutamate amidohydrolase n=1 Tax=Novosphingobium sp. PC22D TaxID=1962403 RepID=UPI000BF0AD03|nr:N-formylglutamate amidohydrolase [Novosphingobium sp. PC22D]PEQ13428.1 N-formylglutamate amidohydrolase [Novosphingobium sp. PC22D]